MEPTHFKLSKEFAEAFDSYFNSDVINLANQEEVLDSAGLVVLKLMKSGKPASSIIDTCSHALANWGFEVVEEFSVASNGNWDANPVTEQKLKDILNEMIREAQYQSPFRIGLSTSQPSEQDDGGGGVGERFG